MNRFAGVHFRAMRRAFAVVALILAAAGLLVPQARASEAIPFPPELKPAVDFWIRVYTEASTREGYLHDERDLSLVYRKLEFARDVTPRERRNAVDAERSKVEAMLRRLAQGEPDLSEEERKLAALFGDGASASRYAAAAQQVRFQLGQSDRFREGLERSSQWEAHIAQTFARQGLPPELSALPHVESSFDPTAYSKVGAAGLWQFMRSTGRRYMRVDDAVDERMDPFRATEAAAQLLAFNHRFLGSWPLALTAYNHGAAGMRRASEAMGTTDIVPIINGYRSRSFGFASRNFYTSFLAALTIDRDPGKYFSNLKPRSAMQFTEVELPAYVPAAELQKLFGIERAKLAELNPAVRPAVWNGSRYLPKGYKLRLPADAAPMSALQLAEALDPKHLHASQHRGRATAPAAAPAQVALAERRAELRVAEAAKTPEPVTAAEAKAESPSLVPGGAIARTAESIDYGISGGAIRVAAEETLGHYADWLNVSTAQLRTLNRMGSRSTVAVGRSVKLDFSKVSEEQFAGKRRAYHESLQASFFAERRITGTQVYVARRGDSLWNVSQRNGGLPAWLVIHYNPDVDFTNLRTGVEIVIPKVEAVPAA